MQHAIWHSHAPEQPQGSRCPARPLAQGEFAPGEPVAAVFGWVADCLSDPLHTYELVLPSRQPLEPRPQSGAWRAGCWAPAASAARCPACLLACGELAAELFLVFFSPPRPAVREAGLLPSVALLFRWTGASAAQMAHAPALRQELLRGARAAAPAF